MSNTSRAQRLSATIVSLSILFTLSGCATAPKAASTPAIPVSKGAVIAGDYPDPSMIRVGSDYWAVATSSAWAPVFPIMHSKDLANWEQVSAVFAKPPTWAKGDFWAPEIVNFNGSESHDFRVYYAARNRSTSKMCVGVATASAPNGPYKDRGPIVCGAIGSIDASAFVDSSSPNAQKYLIWKEDGNSIKKATPLLIQKLNDDGTKLVGKKTTAIVNDSPWERELVEGPFVLKHGDFFYLFYSGNGCCGRDCNYAVGVARAKTVEGPWEKNPNNPILKGNDVWKCPGHGSIAQDEAGRDIFIYHAYNVRDFVYVGRQAMVDQVDWSADGWPTINGGHGPSTHREGFLGAMLRNRERRFYDDFKSSDLRPGWIWPQNQTPGYELTAQGLELTAKKNESLIARATTDGDYVAIAALDLTSLKSASKAALALYGNSKNAIGLSISNGTASVWTRELDHTTGVENFELKDVLGRVNSDTLWMRVSVSQGQTPTFSVSYDGKTWTSIGRIERDAFHLPPWDLGIRVALMAQEGSVRFKSFKVDPRL